MESMLGRWAWAKGGSGPKRGVWFCLISLMLWDERVGENVLGRIGGGEDVRAGVVNGLVEATEDWEKVLEAEGAGKASSPKKGLLDARSGAGLDILVGAGMGTGMPESDCVCV